MKSPGFVLAVLVRLAVTAIPLLYLAVVGLVCLVVVLACGAAIALALAPVAAVRALKEIISHVARN